jgi:hypothetical protein
MKAWKLIEREENWIKGHLAADRNMFFCHALEPNAVCWCAHGALLKTYFLSARYNEAFTKITREVKKLGFEGIFDWNDSPETTHKDVYNLLKKHDI